MSHLPRPFFSSLFSLLSSGFLSSLFHVGFPVTTVHYRVRVYDAESTCKQGTNTDFIYVSVRYYFDSARDRSFLRRARFRWPFATSVVIKTGKPWSHTHPLSTICLFTFSLKSPLVPCRRMGSWRAFCVDEPHFTTAFCVSFRTLTSAAQGSQRNHRKSSNGSLRLVIKSPNGRQGFFWTDDLSPQSSLSIKPISSGSVRQLSNFQLLHPDLARRLVLFADELPDFARAFAYHTAVSDDRFLQLTEHDGNTISHHTDVPIRAIRPTEDPQPVR